MPIDNIRGLRNRCLNSAWYREIASISDSRAKRAIYAVDPYFPLGLEAAKSTLLIQNSQELTEYSSILIKTDGVVSRKICKVLEILKERDLDIVAYSISTLDMHSIINLWRYELNTATASRLEAVRILLTLYPSIFLILRRRETAVRHLSELVREYKGPLDVMARPKECLRAQLGAFSGMVNYIHSPDDTADFIRELGVLSSGGVLRELRQDVSESLRASINTLYNTVPHRNPDPAALLDRIRQHAETVQDPIAEKAIYAEIRNAEVRGICNWQKFRLSELGLDALDIALAGAHFCEPSMRGMLRIL